MRDICYAFMKRGVKTGGEAKVAPVQRNTPSQSVFLVLPTLVAGTYSLEVRARVSGGTELRIGRLDPVLTV